MRTHRFPLQLPPPKQVYVTDSNIVLDEPELVKGVPVSTFMLPGACFQMAQGRPGSALPPAPPTCKATACLYTPAFSHTLRRTPPAHPPPAGKRVVLIEDGPTLTHGGMAYGAGKVRWLGVAARGAALPVQQAGRRCAVQWGTHQPLVAPREGARYPCQHPCPVAWGVAHYCCFQVSLPQYAAEKYGAAEIVDPRPFLVGSMLWTYKKVSREGM